MAATVLNSPEAVQVSVFVVRAFIKMREVLISRSELERRLLRIENVLLAHDESIRELYDQIRPLLLPPPEPARKRNGFVNEPAAKYGRRKSGGARKQICDGNLQYDVCTLRARFTLKLSVTRSRMQAMKYSRGGFA